MLKKFVTLIMVICMLTVSCFASVTAFAADTTCILKSSEEITGGNSIIYKWSMKDAGVGTNGETKSPYNLGSSSVTYSTAEKLVWDGTRAYTSYGLLCFLASNSPMLAASTDVPEGKYTFKIPMDLKARSEAPIKNFSLVFQIGTSGEACKLLTIDDGVLKVAGDTITPGTAGGPSNVSKEASWVLEHLDSVISVVMTRAGDTLKFETYWDGELIGTTTATRNSGGKIGISYFGVRADQDTYNNITNQNNYTFEVGEMLFWEGNYNEEPTDTGVQWICEDNKIGIKGTANTSYNVRLLNPKNGFNDSYSITDYDSASDGDKTSMVAYEDNLTTDSDGFAYIDSAYSAVGKYFAYLSSYVADIKAQSYFYIGGEKLLNDLSANIDNPLFKDFIMAELKIDSDASQKIINDYKALSDARGFVDSSAYGGEYMGFYAAVLFGNMFEQTAYDENLANELKSALTSLGLPTAGFDVLLMNNDYSDVMQKLSDEATTVSSAAEMLFDVSVLKGVKNAIISSEAESFLALIGNSKFDNASTEQKTVIASALKGNEYGSLPELSDAVDGVNITPSVAEEDDELGNTNTGGSKIDFGGGSSSSGPSSPKPSTPAPDVTPTNPEPVTPPESVEPVEYNDVPDTHWAYEPIAKMSEMGIISGYDGSFNPDNDVTRAEYLKMLCKLFEINEAAEGTFGDVSSNDWYAPFVYGAAKEGLVSGDGTNFRPNDSISREDAAVMLYRFMDYKGISLDKTNEVSFADSSEFSDYAVDAIEALSAMGIINGKGDGIFAALDSMTRAEAAKLLLGAISE